MIEDGAIFKGSLDTQRPTAKSEPKRETVDAIAASSAASSFGAGTSDSLAQPPKVGRAGDSAAVPQGVLVEQKK